MSAPARGSTPPERLARLGFRDPGRAAALLAGLDGPGGAAAAGSGEHGGGGTAVGTAGALVDTLGAAADPDLALTALDRLAAATPDRADLLAALRTRPGFRERLVAVLGASAALGEHLARHPAHWRELLDDTVTTTRPSPLGLTSALLAAVGAPGASAAAVGDPGAAADALRVGYRALLLRLAARDLTGHLSVDDAAAELADLAGATLTAALCVARARTPGWADCRLAVIALGKCGARELNYVSDVDVVFVTQAAAGTEEDAALAVAQRLAAALVGVCSATTAEGTIWAVDAGLRPEGRAGPLVRTLASHLAYYQRWAKTWEFQALLKARAVAGDPELGARYVEAVRPLVWSAGEREGFVEDVQAMRRRVLAHVEPGAAGRELKLGPGGLRDVEFAVQLLQLVHGRADDSVRSPNTLAALEALAAGGYVGRQDAARLGEAYRFLRATEHRLQLQRLRRTHLLPADEHSLRWLARALGYRSAPAERFSVDLARHAREVRRLHEKLFYRPLLSAAARVPAEQTRLTPAAARARLEALGFADPAAALRHLEALTAGVSRRAAIQRTLLPVMLGWFADAPDPDAGLLAFRQVSDALGGTPWYLRLLRDEGAVAERLARLLGTSRYVTDLLTRAPEAVALLARDEDLAARPRSALDEELAAAVRRNDDWEAAVLAARGVRRRELLRTAARDLLLQPEVADVLQALSDVAAATVQAALNSATEKVQAERRRPTGVRLAVIGMGRLGGREQGYGSDADVLFVYEEAEGGRDGDDLTQVAHDVAAETRRLLALPAPDPPLVVDAGLRPEGRQGPLVRSLASYAEYYGRWSLPWESQALLRASPVAGDPGVGRRFCDAVAHVRWPPGGLAAAARTEIRRVKARVEAERLPRGADPALHVKLGPGGLADVEWTVQLLQLEHAGRVPALRVTATLEALDAAQQEGLVTASDADVLREAWLLATRVRNATMLVRGRPSDEVPTELRTLAAVSRVLGYPPGAGSALVEDYRRVARRARAVVNRLFYG